MQYEPFECIEQYLEKYAEKIPERTAVIVKNTYTSYSELWRLVRGFARYLVCECGVEKGDCIVVKTMQTLDICVAYFAIHLSGGIFVPLEKSIAKDKAAAIVEETEARVYISRDTFDGLLCRYINIKEVTSIANRSFDENWTCPFPGLEDSADIMYTTGTTGKAKGVEVTHHVLLATAENYIEGFELPDGNIMAVPGPLNHVNPLRKLYMTVMSGNTIVILNGLMSMKSFFHALDDQSVNSLCLPPASLRTIWKYSGDKLSEYADQIDFVESSTAPVTESDKETLRRQLPKSRLYNNYGLSECGAMVMYDFCRYPNKAAGCVGKPTVNSHVMIVDEARQEIESSKEHMGLVACQGPINMKGYWKAPEKTAEVKANGCIYTRDIGYFDEEGFLFVIGRTNDTINVGGLKVEPTEVEEEALLFPGVHECICVPVDDEVTGNALKLIVVTKQGMEFDEAGLRRHLATKLEAYQIPKLYEQAASIPRNFVGKLDRNAFVNGERK